MEQPRRTASVAAGSLVGSLTELTILMKSEWQWQCMTDLRDRNSSAAPVVVIEAAVQFPVVCNESAISIPVYLSPICVTLLRLWWPSPSWAKHVWAVPGHTVQARSHRQKSCLLLCEHTWPSGFSEWATIALCLNNWNKVISADLSAN